MEKLISCIITTYKREPEVLKRAIDSVLNQTYSKFELIIVNDCPEAKDLCIQIDRLINSYSRDIKYIIHPHNMGACQARNTGIDASKGFYVAFLDDDDEWMPTKLEEQLKLFNSNEVGLVYCDCIIRRSGKDTEHRSIPTKYKDDIVKALLYQNFIGGNSFPLIKKQAIIDAGMYDSTLKALQDLDMWVRIAQKYKCVRCEKFLVINHISNVSITTISDNRISAFKRILSKYNDIYINNPKLYHDRLLAISGDLLSLGKMEEFKGFYTKAIRVKPLAINNIIIPVKSVILEIRKHVLKH